MKTAVEWIVEQIKSNWHDIEYSEIDIDDLLEQAKQMEKEQISNAYVYGAAYGIDIQNNLIPNTYYNETFKSE